MRARRIVTADEAIRLQSTLAAAVETWFESLPEAPTTPATRPGSPGDTRLSLELHGRDNHTVTLLWRADPARRVSAVELYRAPGPMSWERPDKSQPLINVLDLERGTGYRFTLWVAYADGGQDQASVTVTTLDI